jgi:secernin
MCDTLAVVGDDGLLFAKNSDRPPDEVQIVESHPRRPAGGTVRTQYIEVGDTGASAFVGSRPTWLWGVEHGVNEHGVAIGNEKLYTTGRPKDRPPALLGMDLVRLGLERGHTADVAVEVITDLVERFGQGGSGEEHADAPYDSSFLVADATGGWIVETCHRTWAVRPFDAGAAISNRITLSTDWTRASADVTPGTDFQTFRHPRAPTTIADHRLAATRAAVALGADRLTPGAAMATLRDHGTGPWGAPGTTAVVPPPGDVGTDHVGVTVCMHVRGHQATTASMIVAAPRDPTAPIRLWALLGNPCVSVYVPMQVGEPVPAPLGDATTWRRFARLRDAVDQDAAALGRIRAVLGPVEAASVDRATPDLPALDAALTTLGV